MSEVSLQAYGAEMRQLVAEGAYEDALAIGRHILDVYPKHCQTYRIMGEACLEQGDYEEAHQLFARALACDPEDLFSRVGIAVAHQKRGDLSLAIWHMERAYELSPGNAELRKELQSLYAKRDGASRPRLKFTSGAVARLYARSRLWPQAIHEFRTLLRQNPDLIDVKVALAEALWNAGAKKEAAQLCQEILETYPHCLKANLILGEIWLHGEREMEGRALLQLAQDIDPENAVAQAVFGERSPLPVRVAKIARLEDVPVPEMPAELDEELQALAEEGVPLPWLEEEAAAPVDEETLEEEVAFEDAIVESEEAVEEPVAAEEELAVEEEPSAVEGVPEMPEAEEAFPEEELLEEEEEGIPDWLQRIRERHRLEDETAEPEAEVVEAEDAEVPDWMRRLGEQVREQAEAAEAEEVPEAEEALPEEGIPDWLKQLEKEAEAQAEAEAEPLPEWLLEEEEPAPQEEVEEELHAEGVDAEIEALLVQELGVVEEEEAEAAEVPDWMRRLGEQVREQAEAAEAEEALVAEAAEVEAPPVPEVEVEEEAPVEAPEAEVGEVVPEAEAPPVPEVEVEEEAPVEAPEAKVEPPPVAEMEAGESEAEAAEVPDWMRRLGEQVREQAEAAEGEEALEAEAEEAAEAEAPPVPEAEVEAEAPVEAPEAEVEEAVPEVEAPPVPEVEVEEEAPVEAPEAEVEEAVPEAEVELPEDVFELEVVPAAAPGVSDAEEILAHARELRDSGDTDAALDLYEGLIRREQLLSNVLADLEEGVSGPLARSRTFTLIGDLCTKQGRLQRALEAYRQALDMLKQ